MAGRQRKKVIEPRRRKKRQALEYWDASNTQEDWHQFSRYKFHPDTEYEPWMVYAYADGSGTFVPPFFRAEHGDAPGYAALKQKRRQAIMKNGRAAQESSDVASSDQLPKPPRTKMMELVKKLNAR